MNLLKIMMGISLMLLSAASFAMPMTFMSGQDDGCRTCTLNSDEGRRYVDPTGTALDGASWIQPDGSWGVRDTYRVWELDLNKTGTASIIDSLFVSYDDRLQIRSRGNILFDSRDHNIRSPWTKVVDIVALTGPIAIAGNGRLNFYVENTGGPTGVIWKGTTAVPEPSTIALLGLGLLGLGMARRYKAA